ncbi:MAG: hypothetical protein AN490_01460 [Anabaena sp. AL09]|nr:MAG: hypothetical protein AN490_01460 [Anabaena sp. AL09]
MYQSISPIFKLENPEILPPALLDTLKELHSQYKSLKDGVVANYIPKLTKLNPDLLMICIVTTNGQIYEVGDFQQPFTIQLIAKVFVYGQEAHLTPLTPLSLMDIPSVLIIRW